MTESLFALRVRYPGTTPIQTQTLPVGLFDAGATRLVRDTVVHLSRGENRSFIQFPPGLGLPVKSFTIDDVDVLWGLITLYPWDINSSSVSAHFDNIVRERPNRPRQMQTALVLEIEFEDGDAEIRDTRRGVSIELKNMKLTVKLPLYVRDGRLFYIFAHPEFDLGAALSCESAKASFDQP